MTDIPPDSFRPWRESLYKGKDIGLALSGAIAVMWHLFAYFGGIPYTAEDALVATLVSGVSGGVMFMVWWRYVMPKYRWYIWRLMPEWLLDEWGVLEIYQRRLEERRTSADEPR